MKACPFCAEEIQDAAVFCKHCRRNLASASPVVAAPMAVSIEKPYYEAVFQRIDQNGGAFLATWNWPAVLFSGIWYLVKGMWANGGVMFGLAILTGGLAAPL